MSQNHIEKETDRRFAAQKWVLYLLLSFIYIGFICSQVENIQALFIHNDALLEMPKIPIIMAVYVVPILFILYLYLFIRTLLRRGRRYKRISFKAIFIIASLSVIIYITAYQSTEMVTFGAYTIKEKFEEDRRYYVKIENKKLNVSFNEFQLVEENKTYIIQYAWNERTPEKGRLQTIEQTND